MGKDKHKLAADGMLEDGVRTYPADAARLKTYETASEQLAGFKAPILLSSNDPHQRVFIAAFDGTGNDMLGDPEHATNVAKINQQIQEDYLPGLAISHSPPALVVSDKVKGLIPSPLTAETFSTVTVSK